MFTRKPPNHSGPDFLCVGQQKAGTQWLYDQLESSAKVWMPPIKELCYFSGKFEKPSNLGKIHDHFDQIQDKAYQAAPETIDFYNKIRKFGNRGAVKDRQYLSLFNPKGERISGDISPVYSTANQRTCNRAARLLPDTKVIFLIRHPVDRLKSALSMHVRKEKLVKNELVDLDELKLLINRKTYTSRSFPSRSWNNWLNAFGNEKCKFWFFDDIVSRPEMVRREIAEYLNLKGPEFTLPANYNRKSKKEKFNVTEEVERYLYSFFQEEIQTCKEAFGGRSLDWKTEL